MPPQTSGMKGLPDMQDLSGFGAIRSLDYVILLCEDLENMTNFYTTLFEFQAAESTPGHMVFFRVGTLFLGLRRRGRSYDGPHVPQQSTAIQLSFRVPPADVDAAYESLVKRKIAVIEAPTNQDWPHRTLFFRDPENNILEVFADIHPRETLDAPSGAHLLTE
ncbi:MAG: VOC family protein [Pseudomonadota bacterium]